MSYVTSSSGARPPQPPTFPRGARSLVALQRRLSWRQGRVLVAAARTVQLGARLVRRGARRRRAWGEDRAQGHRRARRHADLRRIVARVLAPRERTSRAGRKARRSARDDAGRCPELWATMLASMKLGLVMIPAMPQLGAADIADRLMRGKAKYLVALGADAGKFAGLADGIERIAVGETPQGWRSYGALLSGARASRLTARPEPTTRCSSISPRARRRARSSSSTPIRATRSDISRRCMGSA